MEKIGDRYYRDDFYNKIQTNVPVANGYFSVMLGSVNPLAASHFTGPRYLEVRLDTGGGWTILPRQLLGAVPFGAIVANRKRWLTSYSVTVEPLSPAARPRTARSSSRRSRRA